MISRIYSDIRTQWIFCGRMLVRSVFTMYIHCAKLLQVLITKCLVSTCYPTYTELNPLQYQHRNPQFDITLLKLRTLISEHIIGCRKTKLSMERKTFPVCGPSKYICISVVFRHLRNFPEVFQKFSDISGVFFGNFRRFSPIEKLKSKGRGGHGGIRTHNLRITNIY